MKKISALYILITFLLNSVTAQITAKTGFYNWCAPSAWVGGVVPTVGDDVVIPINSRIQLNCNANVKSITVKGTLQAVNNIPLALEANWIMVMGANARFIWGKDGDRYLEKGTITLKGNQNSTPANTHMGDKFLGAMMGGRIDIHGQQKDAWTKLDATASAGTSNIILEQIVNWKKDDWIVIASTDFNPHEAETRQIDNISVSNNRSIIQLKTPLQYTHWGINQTFSGYTLDERAEVGLLSKNIMIQGDPNSENTKFGGHIMIMAGSSIYMDGAQLYRMGQEGIIGRYPFHWHKCRNVNGQYIKNTTVERSYNRAITVHGTDYALIQNNVAYDHIGHGFFLEDASEQFNTFDRNLGILSRIPAVGKEVEPHDAAQKNGGRRLSPATFWITNNQNTFTNNVAAGSEATGFWYAIPKYSFDPLFTTYLPDQEILEFTNNTAHSCEAIGVAFNGFFEPNGVMVNDTRSYNNPPNTTLENNTAYKCAGNGFWSLPNSATYKGWKFADNGSATFHVFDQGFEDCLFVGLSNNLGTLDDPEDVIAGYNKPDPIFILRKSHFNAFAFYDGPLTLKNCHFAEYPKPGFPAENFNILQILGAAVVSPSSSMTGITFSNVGHEQKLTFLPTLLDNTFGPNFDEGVNTTAIAALDNSFSNEIGTYTVKIIPPNTYYPYNELYFTGPNASPRPDWDAWYNPLSTKFGIVLTEGRVQSPEDTDMFVTRTKTNGQKQTVALDKSSKSNPQQWKFMTVMSDGSDYRLQTAEVPLKWVRMKLAHCAHMEYVDVEYVNVPNSLVIADIDLPAGEQGFIQQPSLAVLQGQQINSGYFLEDNTLHVRYVANQNRTTHASSFRTAESTFIDVNFMAPYYSNNDLVPIADFNGSSKDKRGTLTSSSLPVYPISSNGSCNTFNISGNGNANPNEYIDYMLDIGKQVWTGLPYLQVNFSGPTRAEVFIRDGSIFHNLGFANSGAPFNLSLSGLSTKLWDVNSIWVRFHEADIPNSPTAVCFDAIHLSSGTGDLDGDGILDSKEALTCRNINSAADLEFDFPTDTSLWKLANADPDFAVPDVYRMGIGPNQDGQLFRENLNFNGNQCKKIAVRFTATETGTSELFFKTTGDTGYSQTKSAPFVYNTKNQWVEAIFDFTNDMNWTGNNITGLRFDPPFGTTYRAVKVDYIRCDQVEMVTAEHVGGPCQSTTATFQANVGTPDGTEQYQWQYFDGNTWVNIPGGQGASQSSFSINDTSLYRVRVSRPSGCERFSNTIQAPAFEPITVDSDRSICFGTNDKIQLVCQPEGGTWSGPGMVGSPLFINCGGPAVITGTTNWVADSYSTNGNSQNYGVVPIANTTYDAIYQTERWMGGNLNYQIPLPAGEYEIQLHFSELWNGAQNPGVRSFDIEIEGTTIETGYDIFSRVGSNSADIVRQRHMVSDGLLNITIIKGNQNPKINAIAVLPRTFDSNGQPQGVIPMVYNYENQLTGCSESKTTTIDIGTNSTAIATGSQSICLGAYAQLVGSAAEPGATTYQWYVAGTNNQVSNMPNPYLNPITTTSYELVVNVGGCLSSRSAPVTVTVNAQPTVTTQLGESFCENDPDQELLFATPAGGRWTGVGIVGASNYLNAGGPVSTQGGFSWLEDNFSASGLSYTYPANTLVNNTSSPDMYRTERHGNGGDINYQIPVPNGDYEVNLHFAELWPGAFNPGGRTFNISLEGNVVDPLVDIYDQVGGNTALIKEYYVNVQDGILNIDLGKIVQNPKISGVVILPRSFSSLQAGSGIHPIKYTYVDPETGCSAFKAINMTVEAAPAVSVSSDQTICQGGTATFTGSTTAQGTSITYQWYFAGTNTLVANGATLSVSPNQTTSYELAVTVDGCKSFPSIPVTAIVTPPPPRPIVPAAATLCERDPIVVLNATPVGGEWTGPGILGTTLHINAGGPAATVGGKTWVADQHFINGGVFSSSAAINQTASEVVYQTERWAPNLQYEIPVTNATYQIQLHFAELYAPLQAVGARVFDIEIEGNQVENDLDIYFEVGGNEALIKTYTVQVTDGKINIDFLKNVENPKISAISILPISFRPATAGAGTQIINYNYIDPLTGCSNDKNTVYTITPAPVATTSGTTSICTGESATLSAAVTGTGTKIYNWYLTGTSTLVGQGQSITVSPTQTTTYNILARVDGCFSYRSNNVTVTVNPLPATPTVPASKTVCERDVVALVATPAGGNWSGSGVTGTTFHAQAAGSGAHVLTYNYTDGNGCSSTATTTFTVTAAPVAAAAGGGASICAGRSITLTGGTTTAGATITYQWYVAGTSTVISTQQNLTVSPTVDTDYRMIVTVDGCASFPSPIVSVNVDPSNAICITPKLILEGPFNSSLGIMGDDLKENNQLPTTEPYTALGFTVDNTGFTVPASVFSGAGANNDVVDWILVQLRDKTDPTQLIYSAAAFLEQDGEVVTYDANQRTNILDFPVAHDSYYLAVFHRNHLPVMTATPIVFDGATTVLDFSDGLTPTYGIQAQKALTGGIMGLFAGDATGNQIIDASDRSLIWNFRNQQGYLMTDITLDGIVNAADRSMDWNNRNKIGTVEK